MLGETEVFVDELIPLLEELGAGDHSDVEFLTVKGE